METEEDLLTTVVEKKRHDAIAVGLVLSIVFRLVKSTVYIEKNQNLKSLIVDWAMVGQQVVTMMQTQNLGNRNWGQDGTFSK